MGRWKLLGLNDLISQASINLVMNIGFVMTHRWFVLVLGIVSLAWAGLPAWSATLYVSPQGLSVAPYASWSNAANTVHAAMGVAADFDTILLDDGEYALTNQVVVTSAITIRSKNGPAYTTIDGNNYAGKPVTNRCFWVSNSLAVLSGLTVTNGAALRSDWNGQGGGVFLVSGTVTNCVVARNLALGQGGGIAISNANLAGAGWVRNSLIQSNTAAEGGGVCAFANAQVDHCFITGNRATTNGGGVQMAMGGLLVNCVINGNSATNANALGGGVYADRIGLNTGAIYSCTIAGNAAAMGGGVTLNNNTNLSISNLSVYNSIIYNNTATNNVDRYELSQTNGTVLDGSNYWSCCVTTNAVGAPATHRWNFTNAPIWVSVASNDFRLQSHSIWTA